MTYEAGQPKTLFAIVGKWQKIENAVRERMKMDPNLKYWRVPPKGHAM
jgi:hypothetical protein